MKAYLVRDEQSDFDYCTVVFAETRGKAKQEALCADACMDAEFTNISARRIPQLDRFYRGRTEMDWYNDKDRLAMVRYAGMRCSDEVTTDEAECEECPAKDYCERYEYESEG